MKKTIIISVVIAIACLLVSCEKEPNFKRDEPVDLGLSVSWASCNLGATLPKESGLYYQWADPKGYGSDVNDGKYFDWKDKSGNETYIWYDAKDDAITKYSIKSSYTTIDYLSIVQRQDDAATVALGGNWRMPTAEEWKELKENCKWTQTSYMGVDGFRIQSKKAGYTNKWIFLPMSGYRGGDGIYYVGKVGYYWSSTLTEAPAFATSFITEQYGPEWLRSVYQERYYGLSIRPVWAPSRQER